MTTLDGPSRQRILVGDVQGCAEELDDLLDALDYDADRHALWFVGDLVNRGPASARVLRRVMDLGASSVLGNHDLHLLGVAAGERRLKASDRLDDVLEAPDRDRLLEWLRRRPLVQAWGDVVLVHAGVHPLWKDPVAVARPIEDAIARGEISWGHPDMRFLTRVRHCDAQGHRPPDDTQPGDAFAPWDHHYRGSRIVVFGHWAARGLVRGARVRGLDTGCVYGGRLTAWIPEGDRFVSVGARRRYESPNDRP